MSSLNVSALQRANRPFNRPFSRRSFLTIAGISLASTALALTGCGNQSAGAATSGAAGGGLKKVRIGVPGADGTLLESALIAQRKKYLEDELKKVGYEPAYQGFAQAGPAINEAFSSGSLDITEYADFPGYSAIAKGIDIKAFAVTNSSSQFGVYASKASGASELKDLKGKKIVVGFGTAIHHYLLNALKAVGLSSQDVELINSTMDGPTMVASGQADAYTSVLYAIYAQQSKIPGKLVASTLDHDELTSTFLMLYRSEYAKENPKVAPAIVRALKRAYEEATSKPEEAYKQLVTASIPEEVLRKAYPSDFKYFNPQITDDVKKKVESLGEFMVANKLAARKVTADEYFDTEVYQKASK